MWSKRSDVEKSTVLPRRIAWLTFGLGVTRFGPGRRTCAFTSYVDLVQLNVAVTDKKGNYITGLRPQDFVIAEDGIPQKLATFEEGNESARRLLDLPPKSQSGLCR